MRSRIDPDTIFATAIDIIENDKRDANALVNAPYYVGYNQTLFAAYVAAAGLPSTIPDLFSVTNSSFVINNKITDFLSKYDDIEFRTTPLRIERTTKHFIYTDISGYSEVQKFKPYIKAMINE